MASKSPQHSTKTPFFSHLIELESQMNNSIPNNEETSDDETLENVTLCSSSKKKALSRKKILSSQDEKDAIKDSINSKEGILMNSSILNNEETTDDETLEDVTPCSSAKKKALLRKKVLSSQEEKDAVKDSINTKEGILMNSSIPNNEETTSNETLEDVTPCSSAKKKALSRKKVLSSQEEKDSKEGILIDRSKDPIDSEKTVRYNSDSEEDDIGGIGIKNTARQHGEEKAGAKKRKATISSIDDEDDFTPQKQIRTEREKNARKKSAMEQLVHSRNHTKGSLNMTVDAERGSPGESQLSSSDDETSVDESDLDDFLVGDSQSQELAKTSLCFCNLSKEELFDRFVETILNSIVDEEFSSSLQNSNDCCFKKAQTYWENLINTTKDRVVSSRWKDYKKMLMEYPVMKSESQRFEIRQQCEGCLLQRTLSKCVAFYEEPYGRKIKEFKVGRHCARRGWVYHRLHHFKEKLRESCSKKVKEVRNRARTGTPKEIVEKCIEDKEWLDELFRDLKSKLNDADTCPLGG